MVFFLHMITHEGVMPDIECEQLIGLVIRLKFFYRLVDSFYHPLSKVVCSGLKKILWN